MFYLFVFIIIIFFLWFVIAMSWLGHSLGPLDWVLKRHDGAGPAGPVGAGTGVKKKGLVNKTDLGYRWWGGFGDKETRPQPDLLPFLVKDWIKFANIFIDA